MQEPVLVLSAADLKAIARGRLADAMALLKAGRFDGSAYLSGYVVELLRIGRCTTLKWPGFPEKRSEFEGFQSFKTHDLDVLLRLSGREQYIKVTLFPEWTVVSQWNPEARYQAVGTVTAATAQNMISAGSEDSGKAMKISQRNFGDLNGLSRRRRDRSISSPSSFGKTHPTCGIWSWRRSGSKTIGRQRWQTFRGVSAIRSVLTRLQRSPGRGR